MSPRRPSEEDEAVAGPSGLNAPVTLVTPVQEKLQERMQEKMRLKKRKRSIQKYLDLHVIQEAETEARLEESAMEEEIVSREHQVFENRR